MQVEKALHTLCDADVDFVVIGGLSATFHGSARITYDLDICYSRESANHCRAGAVPSEAPRVSSRPIHLG